MDRCNRCFIRFLWIVAPVHNVATLEANAIVSEGVSRVRNALINGDYHSYDWDSGKRTWIVSRLGEESPISRIYLPPIGLRWHCHSTISTLCGQFDAVSVRLIGLEHK